ncbi:hypothetical protein [Nonomuraea dietziae]|uniref:hypothetical protein n=1 Tax=Nonomuraea dietziae TaxID=65515 RepID=UPI0031CFF915
MTRHNYFPRKEDMAFDHHEAFVASLALTVSRARSGESALAALPTGLRVRGTRARDPVIGFAPPRSHRMIADSTRLVARLRDLERRAADGRALCAPS